ncbi:hypothetical protein H0E87_020623, partial [Populus deltoides]
SQTHGNLAENQTQTSAPNQIQICYGYHYGNLSIHLGDAHVHDRNVQKNHRNHYAGLRMLKSWDVK